MLICIAEMDGRLVKVQVKTWTYQPADATDRWHVSIATCGGKRSWTGSAKVFDRSRVTFCSFSSGTADGGSSRACAVEASRASRPRRAKYSEFEIAPGAAIERSRASGTELNTTARSPRGSARAVKGADCKSAGYAYAGSNPASPISTGQRPDPLPAETSGDDSEASLRRGRIACRRQHSESKPMVLVASSLSGSERQRTRRPAATPSGARPSAR